LKGKQQNVNTDFLNKSIKESDIKNIPEERLGVIEDRMLNKRIEMENQVIKFKDTSSYAEFTQMTEEDT